MRLQKQLHRFHRLIHHCLLGYRWFFFTLGKAALFLITLLLSASLVVIPLWYLATTYPTFYGYLVAGILSLGILIPLFRSILKVLKNTSRGNREQQWMTKVRRFGFILMEIFLFLGLLRSYQEGNLVVAFGIACFFLLALGLGFYRYHEK